MRTAFRLSFLLVLPALAAAVAVPAARSQERPASDRVMQLSVEDVGRLALRNDPRYRAATLAPEIQQTFEEEALAEFDSLFTSRAGFTRSQSRVFFQPSGVGSTSDEFLKQNEIAGDAGVGRTEEWGGAWRLSYQASSQDRRGASSVNSLSPRYDGTLSLGYTHPLLRGSGREIRMLPTEQARARTRGSEYQLQRNAELVVADAEILYWELVGAIADVEVIVKSVEVANELLAVTEARLASGSGTRVDVTEARAGVARREVELIAAQTARRNAEDRLRERILPFSMESGMDLGLRLRPQDAPEASASEVPADPGEEGLVTALGRRPDVRAIRADVEAARLLERQAEDGTLYALDAAVGGSLRGQGSGMNDSNQEVGDGDQYVWNAELQLTIPFGNRAALARERRARRQRMQVEREFTSLRNQVVREIREAVRNVRSAAERIEAADRARVASLEQLEAERSRLENGRSTPFRVLQVEEDLASARANLIRARVDYEQARVARDLAESTILRSRGLEHLSAGSATSTEPAPGAGTGDTGDGAATGSSEQE